MLEKELVIAMFLYHFGKDVCSSIFFVIGRVHRNLENNLVSVVYNIYGNLKINGSKSSSFLLV